MVNVMAQRFHGVYGPPDTVVVIVECDMLLSVY